MINEKAIKAADLIDVSDKPPVSNFRVGILFMFFFLSETGEFQKRRRLEKPQYCSEYPDWRFLRPTRLCMFRKIEITRQAIYVHSCQQKSIGLKFSKSQTGSDVRYSCHHNQSHFTFPIFAHSCRFSVLHSLREASQLASQLTSCLGKLMKFN